MLSVVVLKRRFYKYLYVGCTMHNEECCLFFFCLFYPILKLAIGCQIFLLLRIGVRSQGWSSHGKCVVDNEHCVRDIWYKVDIDPTNHVAALTIFLPFKFFYKRNFLPIFGTIWPHEAKPQKRKREEKTIHAVVQSIHVSISSRKAKCPFVQIEFCKVNVMAYKK